MRLTDSTHAITFLSEKDLVDYLRYLASFDDGRHLRLVLNKGKTLAKRKRKICFIR